MSGTQGTAAATAERGGIGKSVAAALTVTSVFLLPNAPTPMYTTWQAQWGFSSGLTMLVFAAMPAGMILSLLFVGRLADLRGRRIVVVPAIVITAIANLFFLFAQDVSMLLIGRLLTGMALGCMLTAGIATIVDLAPAHRKRTASLIASMSTVTGAGLGPLMSGFIFSTSETPQTTTFVLLLAVSLVALVIALRLPFAGPADGPRPRGSLFRWPRPPRSHRRELVWGITAAGCGLTSTAIILSIGPWVLERSLGIAEPLVTGAVACGMYAVATSSQALSSKLQPRAQLTVSLTAAICAMLALFASVTAVPELWVFLFAAAFAGIAQGLGQLSGITLIATRIPQANRAESNAALTIMSYAPAGALPLVTGYLVDAGGLGTAVVIFSSCLGALAVIALPLVRASSGRELERDPQ